MRSRLDRYLQPKTTVIRIIQDKLSDLWDRITTPIERVFRSVCRVFAYIPVVWGNEEWDNNYLLQLIEFKLRRMSKYHTRHGHLMKKDRSARQMLIAATLIKRLSNDKYRNEQINKLLKDHPGNDLMSRLKKIYDSNGTTFYKYESDTDSSFNRLLRKEMKLRTEMQKREWAYLIKLLDKHLQSWWD